MKKFKCIVLFLLSLLLFSCSHTYVNPNLQPSIGSWASSTQIKELDPGSNTARTPIWIPG